MPAESILTFADGPIEVELLPAIGARLHRLRVFGHDLLRTPDDPGDHQRDPFSWGAYVMAPWCNRIAATPTEVEGRVVALASNFADGSAIHGQVYATPWELGSDGLLRTAGGGDGWPWRYESTLRVTVRGAALQIEQSLTNLADGPMPAGIGLHPWFRRPLEVRIDAQRTIPSNLDPASKPEPVAGTLDLREMAPMPAGLDAAWLDVGNPPVELRWPTLGVAASLHARSDAGVWIVAASPPGLDAVAIEPQTHAPHGLARFLNDELGGLVALAPQASLHLSVQMTFTRTTSAS